MHAFMLIGNLSYENESSDLLSVSVCPQNPLLLKNSFIKCNVPIVVDVQVWKLIHSLNSSKIPNIETYLRYEKFQSFLYRKENISYYISKTVYIDNKSAIHLIFTADI